MDRLMDLPFPVRAGLLFVLGAALGAVVNWAVYALAWTPRPFSPWCIGDGRSARLRRDFLPIFGWWFLRRKESTLGRGFWLRPMLVEIVSAAGLPLLYWWEVESRGLLGEDLALPDAMTLHYVFFKHAILMAFMLTASLIDVDEQIIPDSVTIPGTLIGLTLAAILPTSHLPVGPALSSHSLIVDENRTLTGPPPPFEATFAGSVPLQAGKDATHAREFLTLSSPFVFPKSLEGQPHGRGALVGLFCWWLWIFALLPRRWYGRKGWRKAFVYFWARLFRSRVTGGLLVMGIAGSALILFVWVFGGAAWRSLLSSLVGMAASASLVWLIRIVGSMVLDREAMGFGDVTLMAMLGAFLGWQPGIILFFLSPFAALGVGLLILLLHGRTEIPFGPFLCLAASATVVFWSPLWTWTLPVFALGPLLILVAAVCVVLFTLLLMTLRLLRERLL
ncbi:prepilin peptidase [Thermopirellula anaerolimosa]